MLRNYKSIDVNAMARFKAEIDPLDAIHEIKKTIFGPYWVEKKENGKYFLMEEVGAGQHSYDDEIREVGQDFYELQESLKKVENYIRQQQEMF